MTIPINPNAGTNISNFYKTIMVLRAAHAPMDEEEEDALLAKLERAAAYVRVNSFIEPRFISSDPV